MNLSIVILTLSCLILTNSEELVIELEQGMVRGFNSENDLVYEFHGIPYATTPTGENKFQPPLPPPSWDDVYNATNINVLCPQIMASGYAGEEDCLVINVYKPSNSRTDNPVVVHVHGGVFTLGYGNMWLSRSLAQEDIVAVTFNYRLGPQGFLCLKSEKIPGNAGLRDQLAALRWVQSNIDKFGGNPQDVTIAGFSAGSASTELLMLSPATINLFSKVILESGSAIGYWAVNTNPLDIALSYGQALGGTDLEDINNLDNFYTSLSLEELYSQIPMGSPLFVPCIEDDIINIEKIIYEHPLHTLQNNTYVKLPILTGYTDAEGLLFEPNKNIRMREMNEDFSTHLPKVDYPTEQEKSRIANLVKSFYFGEGEINDDKFLNYVQYFTDIEFSHSIITSARYHTVNGAPTYLYEFAYVDSQEAYGKYGIGADHCAQTYKVLNQNYMWSSKPDNFSEADIYMRSQTTDLWSKFIINGEPGIELWQPLNLDDMNYLNINLEMNNQTWPLKERIELWDNVYQQISDYSPDSASGLTLCISIYVVTSLILFAF